MTRYESLDFRMFYNLEEVTNPRGITDKNALWKTLSEWLEEKPSGYYEYRYLGEPVVLEIPQKTSHDVLNITKDFFYAIADAMGDLSTQDYEDMEKKDHLENEPAVFFGWSVKKVVLEKRLFARYAKFEEQLSSLTPRDYPYRSYAYLINVMPEILETMYIAMRFVDKIEERYEELARIVFFGFLTIGWGEYYGWEKKNGVWRISG